MTEGAPIPSRRGGARTRALAAAAAALSGLGLLALALAWHDVLPGGWRLRGFVKPHAVRDAEARAAHRAARLALFRSEPAAAPGAIVFLGSSTIERFPLREAFPGLHTLNRGIGDEPLAELCARLAVGLPPDPGAFVVYGGSVDARRLGRSAEEVAAEAERVLDALAARAPGAPIAWIGVLPDRTMSADVAARVSACNAALAALSARRGHTFVPTHRAPLVDAAGRLSAAASVDELHLSQDGYEALAGFLREAFPPLTAAH